MLSNSKTYGCIDYKYAVINGKFECIATHQRSKDTWKCSIASLPLKTMTGNDISPEKLYHKFGNAVFPIVSEKEHPKQINVKFEFNLGDLGKEELTIVLIYEAIDECIKLKLMIEDLRNEIEVLKKVCFVQTKNAKTVQANISPMFKGIPLGLENGKIKDSQISCSQQANTTTHSCKNGRLNLSSNGWSANPSTGTEWFKVDFKKTVLVSGFAMQGWGGYWITGVGISYCVDDKYWEDYDQPLKACTDSSTVVHNEFDFPILTRFIRINSKSGSYANHINGRFEFYGCEVLK